MYRFAGKAIFDDKTVRCEGNYDNVHRGGKTSLEGVIFSNDDKTFHIGPLDLYIENTQLVKVVLHSMSKEFTGRYCYQFTSL